MGLFDLDENLNQGSNAYEKELRKAKLHVLREEFDKAEAIYNAILEEDMEVLGAYIGLVRVYSKDFTILEGDLIDKNVRIIDKIFDDIDDEDYLDFIARRKKAKREAEEEAKRKEELKKAAEEKKRKAEAEKKKKAEEAARKEREKREREEQARKKAEEERIKRENEKAKEAFRLHAQDGEFFDPNLTEIPFDVIDLYKEAEVLVIPPQVKMYSGMLKNFKKLRKLICPKTKGVAFVSLFAYDLQRHGFETPLTLKEVRIEGGYYALESSEFVSAKNEKGHYSPIEKLVLGNGIERIEDLQLMDNLKDFSIPQKVCEIPDGAFIGCTALTSILIPKSVTRIGWRAFAGCSSLEKVIFEDGSNGLFIDSSVFEDCPALREIAIPAKASVKGSLFPGCTSLEKVSCSVALMPSSPFGGDNSIKELVLEFDGIHSTIDSSLLPRIPIDTLVFKEGFTDLAAWAFTSSQNIRHIKFPSSLRRMGRLAFNGCKVLEEVEMPSRMDYIQEEAFYSCSSLKELTIPEGITTLTSCIFQCTALSVLRLPSTLRECRTGVRATGSNHLTVKYPGTMAQWKAIKGGEYFSLYKGCSVECSDGTIVGQYD